MVSSFWWSWMYILLLDRLFCILYLYLITRPNKMILWTYNCLCFVIVVFAYKKTRHISVSQLCLFELPCMVGRFPCFDMSSCMWSRTTQTTFWTLWCIMCGNGFMFCVKKTEYAILYVQLRLLFSETEHIAKINNSRKKPFVLQNWRNRIVLLLKHPLLLKLLCAKFALMYRLLFIW